MRATGLAELYVPIDVSATFLSRPRPSSGASIPGSPSSRRSPTSRWSSTCRAGCRARRCSPFSAARSATSIRRQPSGCRAGAGRDGAGRPLPDRCRSQEGHRALKAAYNDGQGVTAEFNRNMLLVLNHELGADFDPCAFEHRAFYDTRGAPDRDAPGLLARTGVEIPGSVRWRHRGRVDPDRDQHQVRSRERLRAVRRRGAPDRGLAHRSGHVCSAWSWERPHEHAHPRTLAADLAARIFAAPASASLTPRRRGGRGRVDPDETVEPAARPWKGRPGATLPILRRYGARQGGSRRGPPRARPVSRFPAAAHHLRAGGQLEYSSRHALAERAAGLLTRSFSRSARRRRSEGIDLLTVGLDPANSLTRRRCCHNQALRPDGRVPGRRGPAGGPDDAADRCVQIALDMDDEPWLRWRVLNAAAPYVTAIFANSPLYDGEPTGYPRARAPQVWRALDPARTGLPWAEEIRSAPIWISRSPRPAMLFRTIGGEYRSFGEWLRRAEPRPDEWLGAPHHLVPRGAAAGALRAPLLRRPAAALVRGPARAGGGDQVRSRRHPRGRRAPRPARRGRARSRAGRWASATRIIGARRHGAAGHRAPRLRRPRTRLFPPRRSGAGAGLLRLLHPSGPEPGGHDRGGGEAAGRRGGSRSLAPPTASAHEAPFRVLPTRRSTPPAHTPPLARVR